VDDDAILAEQKRYYSARAPEYDDWWFRRGRYAHDPPHVREGWFADQRELETILDAFTPDGEVLELAAGTGLWTRHLVRHATRVTAVDASPEVLALNRARVDASNVDYVVADIFAWQPTQTYDVCFFGFWLSHVPESRFDDFWKKVAAALRAGGRVFLVDGAAQQAAHTSRQTSDERTVRTLADGREFEIVKRFWEPDDLASRLASLGWRFAFRCSTNGHFLYGSGASERQPSRYSSPR